MNELFSKMFISPSSNNNELIVSFDLQFFSEEKTEKPTPKKLKDARDKGQVVQSKDFNQAIGLLAVFSAFTVFADFFSDRIFSFFQNSMDRIAEVDVLFTDNNILAFFGLAIQEILISSLPLLVVAVVVGVMASIAQVGFLFTTEPLTPKLSKIDPIKGFKNMFSSKAFVEFLKSIFKAGIVLYISVSYIIENQNRLFNTIYMDIGNFVVVMWDLLYNIIIRTSVALFIIAVLDYAYKKWSNTKELMMSKYEIKQEYKQSEGDPQLKSKIKEKQRQMAMSRMMSDVPKADVVITNPTHYAIAIEYKEGQSAPKILAKGADLVALNIKRIATEHGVVIVENKPLARQMYDTLEIGEFIPESLYEAVAEILAYVYSLKEK